MDENDVRPQDYHFVPRSSESLRQLAVEYRWEFTRRHPYYLLFWEGARDFLINPSEEPCFRLVQECASRILQLIGVSPTEPPPCPAADYESINSGCVGGIWEGGAVSPAMLQTLATILLLSLPKAERHQLGRILVDSAEFDKSDIQFNLLLTRFLKLPGDAWKGFPDAPFISINLQAPQRAILDAVTKLVQKWKQDRGIAETRRRDDKLEEYLKVWDLREGWHEGAYRGERERRLSEIARDLRRPLTTISNQYKASFRYLVGHDYRPELWLRLFGPVKLSGLVPEFESFARARRRPWQSRSIRPVAEGIVDPRFRVDDGAALLAGAGFRPSEFELLDMQLDIQELIGRGRSDAEICEELELPANTFGDLIDAMRSRETDSL